MIFDFSLQKLIDQQYQYGGYTYLAAPYSHDDPAIIRQRVANVNKAAGELIARGVMVFSPISHCHPIAEVVGLPGSFDYWRSYNELMLYYATSMTVLMLGDWHESRGVLSEREFADQRIQIPVYMLSPLVAFDLDR